MAPVTPVTFVHTSVSAGPGSEDPSCRDGGEELAQRMAPALGASSRGSGPSRLRTATVGGRPREETMPGLSGLQRLLQHLTNG